MNIDEAKEEKRQVLLKLAERRADLACMVGDDEFSRKRRKVNRETIQLLERRINQLNQIIATYNTENDGIIISP